MSTLTQLIKIKNITLIFIIGIILGFATIILYIAMEDKKENLDHHIELKAAQLDLAFTKRVFELQNHYNAKLEKFINNNDELIKAFADRNRKELDKLTQIQLEKLMKENPNFELICFGLPNMTAFYRAHMPKKFGDDISKVHGIQTVTKLKKRVSGFLVSKLGLYYRVTFPVNYQGKYIGLIAFGINLNYVNDFIKENFGTESAIIVSTKTLKQSKWYNMLEEGSIGSYTIISSNGELITKLANSEHNIDTSNIKLESDDKIYNVHNTIKIKNQKNKPIAKVILFQDVTEEINAYNIYFYLFITILSILIIVLSFVLVKTFNRFLTTIIGINDDLKVLNESLEDKVKERTENLEVANKNLENLIDSQDNIVILTNGKEITFANKQFLKFLNYKNLESFKKDYRCICELFVHNDRFFHLGKIGESQNWIEEIQHLPDSQRVISLMDTHLELRAFSVNFNTFDKEILIVSFTDISQTMINQIELENKTTHDKLTGAYNREYFEQTYKLLIHEYTESNHLFGLALLDIDHFKIVNDTHGHDVGDYVLKHFVDVVQKSSRADDIFIRWGGEEFIMIVKVHSEEDLKIALEHIRKSIELEEFETIGHKTCSIGGTIYKDNEDIEKTIKRADDAVYEAKETGRNKVLIKL